MAETRRRKLEPRRNLNEMTRSSPSIRPIDKSSDLFSEDAQSQYSFFGISQRFVEVERKAKEVGEKNAELVLENEKLNKMLVEGKKIMEAEKKELQKRIDILEEKNDQYKNETSVLKPSQSPSIQRIMGALRISKADTFIWVLLFLNLMFCLLTAAFSCYFVMWHLEE